MVSLHPENPIQLAEAKETAAEMVETASAFLNSLESEQRRRTVFHVAGDARLTWDYRPVSRVGLPLADMDSSQQRRALALLASGLSRRGNMTALAIMSLEKILAGLEGSSGLHLRNPDHYYLTIFGEPATDKAWGWRFEGHHLSVNFLIVDGCGIACSPNFFGANPARVPKGPLAGFRTLTAEEDAARRLLAALDERQAEQALIGGGAPPDILTRWAPRVRLDDPIGVAVAALNEQQLQLVLQLIKVYLGRMAPRLADRQLDAIDRQGFGSLHFAWAGPTQPGKPHYYRLHGPSFLVEYDNTQDDANHIHSVWRDVERDWGDDLLRKHYARAHHADQ